MSTPKVEKPLGFSLSRVLLVLVLLVGPLPAGADPKPAPVTTQPLQSLVIFPLRDAPATAVSLNDARVSAQIDGTVMAISVRVGDSVEAGDVVAELDCVDHQLARQQAEAALQAARARNRFAEYQERRAAKLLKSKSVSEETMQQRRAEASASGAEVARLAAALRAAERTVEKCKIVAPFNAVVTERVASMGELAAPGTVVVSLMDQENIEVSAMVQEQDLEVCKEHRPCDL